MKCHVCQEVFFDIFATETEEYFVFAPGSPQLKFASGEEVEK